MNGFRWSVGAFLVVASALAGCAPAAVVIVSPGYGGAKVQSVSLAGFTDFPGAAGSGDIAASTFEKYLLLAGYRVMARASDPDLNGPGGPTKEQLNAAGSALGVDALAFGTLSDYSGATDQTVMVDMPQEQTDPIYGQVTTTQRSGDTRVRTTQSVVTGYSMTTTDAIVPEQETTPASVSMTVRLLDVTTGEVLWSVSSSGTGGDLPSATEAASSAAMQALVKKLKQAPGK